MNKELTKESILIDNQPAFKYMLHYDWEKGVIWLSKNKNKGKQVRITTKDVYISESEKDRFYRSRTGYDSLPEIGIKSECSYLLKDSNLNIFNYWREFMYNRYMGLKKLQGIRLMEDR